MHKISSNSFSFESLHDRSTYLNTCSNISQSPYFEHTTMALTDHTPHLVKSQWHKSMSIPWKLPKPTMQQNFLVTNIML